MFCERSGRGGGGGGRGVLAISQNSHPASPPPFPLPKHMRRSGRDGKQQKSSFPIMKTHYPTTAPPHHPPLHPHERRRRTAEFCARTHASLIRPPFQAEGTTPAVINYPTAGFSPGLESQPPPPPPRHQPPPTHPHISLSSSVLFWPVGATQVD